MAFQAGRGLVLVVFLILGTVAAKAAPHASIVMDMRDGEVLFSRNADTKLHPASLTKMMTLYLVFDAVQRGELSLDQKVRISRNAAKEPPSKLGLREGQTIELTYLIRAAAVKSANDAATALGEAVSGSEAAFARKMTATARAMGMSNTTFKNAHGLTADGHLSTARDMALLGRRLFFDFPQYYNLFSRRSTSAKLATVYNTNRRLLDAYRGADGIKTGYTRAAGFNLVSSAQRGNKRVIVALFGGASTADRNRQVAELMDMGFARMPEQKMARRPAPLSVPSGDAPVMVARADTTLKTAMSPQVRPRGMNPQAAVEIAAAVTRVAAEAAPPQLTTTKAVDPEEVVAAVAAAIAEPVAITDTAAVANQPAGPVAGARVPLAIRPMARPAGAEVARAAIRPEETEVPAGAKAVRADNKGNFVVELGGTHNRTNAERLLLTTALQEMEALEGSRRDLLPAAGQPGWYRARFVGLSEEAAQAACARLVARQTPCQVLTDG